MKTGFLISNPLSYVSVLKPEAILIALHGLKEGFESEVV
jgi:hypothetical protein